MSNFNQFWETEIYGKGKHLNKYPFDSVVTFLFRNYPRNKAKNEVRILEVGSGAGNNLWFAAREGFQVTGIDGSPTAIEFCRKRFQEENLKGNFVVGDFTSLPFEDDTFDIVIDRGSIVCCSLDAGNRVISEVYCVLMKGGKFFFNPYSQAHTSFVKRERLANGLSTNIKEGTLVGAGDLCFYSYEEVLEALPESHWKIISLKHKELREFVNTPNVHAEWEVIAEKI